MKDRVKREVSPEIDAVRATVTSESAEQQLALAQAGLGQDKLGLARIVILPVEQEFALTTELGFTKAPQQDLYTLVSNATAARQDPKAAAARVEFSKQQVAAQSAKRLPELEVRANAGETGVNFGHAFNIRGRGSAEYTDLHGPTH